MLHQFALPLDLTDKSAPRENDKITAERRRTQANKVLRSSITSEWYTPPEVIDRVRKSFDDGPIALDPCSNELANQVVGALYYFSADGLSSSWDAKTIFVNPPYCNETAKWVEQASSCERSLVVLLVNNHTHRKWFSRVWNANALCFPFRPIRFLTPRAALPEGAKGYTEVPGYSDLARGAQPPHGSVIAAFAGTQVAEEITERFVAQFCESFSDFGKIIRQTYLDT